MKLRDVPREQLVEIDVAVDGARCCCYLLRGAVYVHDVIRRVRADEESVEVRRGRYITKSDQLHAD